MPNQESFLRGLDCLGLFRIVLTKLPFVNVLSFEGQVINSLEELILALAIDEIEDTVYFFISHPHLHEVSVGKSLISVATDILCNCPYVSVRFDQVLYSCIHSWIQPICGAYTCFYVSDLAVLFFYPVLIF